MEIILNGVRIHYNRSIGNGPTILLLHGWGVNSTIWERVFKYFSQIGRDVISIDFPGFGESDRPDSNWGIYDYADIVNDFITELSLNKVILVGHSFGGRVSIILSSEYNYVEKLVLVSSAGLKPRYNLRKKIAIIKYKINKHFGNDVSQYGSEDYKALDPEMKNVFIKVVNTFLDKKLKAIKCPCLILWGSDDNQTPLYMAKKLNNRIQNSILKIFDKCGHFCFLENPEKFNIILDSFLRR